MSKARYSSHAEFKEILLNNPEFKKGYDGLEDEFTLFEVLLQARLNAGKTQDDIAKSLSTTTSAISRLENAGGKNHHSPSISTLRKYAKALNCSLHIQLVPYE